MKQIDNICKALTDFRLAAATQVVATEYGHKNEASNGVNVGRRRNALMFSGFVGARCGRPGKTKRAFT